MGTPTSEVETRVPRDVDPTTASPDQARRHRNGIVP